MAILITRPDEQGKQLAEMLNKVGIANIHLPFFSISAGSELNELPNKISQLNEGDYVFCASPNAAKYASETLKATGFHWREDLHYIAVGQTTAESFASQAGVTVHYPHQQQNSEAVLKLDMMQRLANKNLLILRGNGGREYLPQQAELAGANVILLESYQRIPLSYNNLEQIDLCKRANITQVLATSAEILMALIDFVPAEEQNWLKSCQLITSSQRIAKLAEQAGWTKQNILISPKADNATLVDILLTH